MRLLLSVALGSLAFVLTTGLISRESGRHKIVVWLASFLAAASTVFTIDQLFKLYGSDERRSAIVSSSPAGAVLEGREPAAPERPTPDGKKAKLDDKAGEQAQQLSTAGRKEAFFLQPGAFTNSADADNLKARLALLGVDAGIETSTAANKEVWHRVRIGPFTNVEDLNQFRDALKKNGVRTTIIKANDEAGEQAQQMSTPGGKEAFFLQPGAFTNSADADNLKARLALLGVDAGIETSTAANKEVWHRVRIGPFTNVEDLNQFRDALKKNGVQTTVIKANEPER